MLAIQHFLLVRRKRHLLHGILPEGHAFLVSLGIDYPLRVTVTVAFSPTSGASISTQSPVLIVVTGSLSSLSTAGISPAMAPLMSIKSTSWQMRPAGPWCDTLHL